MKYTKLIALLATMFVAVSCVNHDLEFDGGKTDTNTEADLITVYGNVARFADCEVNTRANKTPEESYVSRMALAVFPIVDGVVDDCIHYELRDGSNLLYTVDRAKINEKYGDQYEDTPCVMYILANMPQLESSYNGSADDLLNLALTTPGLARPEDGFPMIGSLGDINRDGKEFVLMPMTGNRMGLPTVNGTPTDYLNIPMSAIFAKISFEIAVTPDQDVDVNAPARFEMTGYEVHNLAERASFNSELNKDESEQPENKQPVRTTPVEVSMTGIAQGGNEGSGSIIEFDFYLPERLLTPETSAENYGYPLGENGTIVGYNDIPNENKKYAQRYKPMLLGDDQKATFVRIKGQYRDHNEEYYTVEYDIYLGADNYGDFNIVRNNQYYNKLNIKGITSSIDQAVNENAISVDHRVNVERSSPLIISLRRETQLDAHYEVRPLRLRIAGGSDATVPEGAEVLVEVLNVDGTNDIPDWVRLEKSGTSDNYITSGVSAGKRKYFTTNLVTETLAANKEIKVAESELSTTANATVWIYVDEADPDEATTTRTTRSAIIRVTYTDNDGNSDTKDYHLSQYNLHKIQGTYNSEPYYIECFEEYLYNYDSEDNYGQIREEGMPWGLPKVQLSNEHRSFTNNTNNSSWNNYVNSNTLPTYDFYIAKHDGNFAVIAGATMVHRYAGQHFTEDIVKKSNNGVSNLTMDQQPSGAVEYCYNRNKRNSDGSIAKVEWYLPSADELEDFIVPAYNYYEEFQENFYWTSQPAYIRNVYFYQDGSNTFPFIVYDDNPEYARATKVVAKGNNVYEYALSGQNEKTNVIDSSTGKILDLTGSGEINFGYFYLMYRWKNGTPDTTFGQGGNYGGVVNGTQYLGEAFDEILGGSKTNTRYHIHLGHLYDMTQEGYHLRTKSNRVRCIRKDYSADAELSDLIYTVSPTPATTLDTSGNTLYVMSNTAYSSTYLTNSGSTVSASSSNVSKDNLVIIQNNKIKSIANGLYYKRDNSNVSLNYSASNFTFSKNGDGFTISSTERVLIWNTTYYLKQTSNSSVSMSDGSGNSTWYFYEVTIQ